MNGCPPSQERIFAEEEKSFLKQQQNGEESKYSSGKIMNMKGQRAKKVSFCVGGSFCLLQRSVA